MQHRGWLARWALPCGTHELHTRQAGHTRFVQMHLELDEAMSLKRAHAIADEIEKEILDFLPGADVIIHQDPIDDSKKRLAKKISG